MHGEIMRSPSLFFHFFVFYCLLLFHFSFSAPIIFISVLSSFTCLLLSFLSSFTIAFSHSSFLPLFLFSSSSFFSSRPLAQLETFFSLLYHSCVIFAAREILKRLSTKLNKRQQTQFARKNASYLARHMNVRNRL